MNCQKTHKRIFNTKLDALIKVSKAQGYSRYNSHRHYEQRPVRVYQCPFCHKWHLTHQRDKNKYGKTYY